MNQPEKTNSTGKKPKIKTKKEAKHTREINSLADGDKYTSKQHKKTASRAKRSKPFTVFLTVLLMIVIMVGFAAAGAIMGGYIAIIQSIPDLGIAGIQPRTYTSIIYDNANKEISKLHGDENREYATLDAIPKYMQYAIISIEDERFYEHDGIDVRGIFRAAYSTMTHKQVQGGSTITQQLIKNNVTNVTRNTIKTKIKEQYLALKYEKDLTEQLKSKTAAKDYIMELYLNTISFGHGYNGVQVAAQGYFGKDAKDLTLAECACLAGITNNPSLYSPRTNPENNKKRQTIILNYMLAQQYITQEEYDAAIDEDIYSKVRSSSATTTDFDGSVGTANIHSYYEDALIDQISTDLQTKYNMTAKQANNIIYNAGLQVYSNYDERIQGIVDEVMLDDSNFPKPNYSIDIDYVVSIQDSATGETTNDEYRKFARSKAGAEAWVADKKAEIEKGLSATQTILADRATYNVQPQCSMAIIDYHTGAIKAIAGGRGKKTVNRGFNRATDSERQPGSVFKVLAAYAPAIDMGKLTAASIIVDEPYTTADGYTPKNWWGASYRGAVTARQGIKDSMNVVAVKIMVETGIDACYDYLLNFGFTTLKDDNHAATALGGLTNGVTQVELAAAYGTIANNGEYMRPMFYEKVLDHEGNVLLENTKTGTQVLQPSTGYILTQMMTSVVTEGTGTAAKFQNSKMPVSGKTGTTTDSKDLTFVGYTPYYVASIWYGYDRYDQTVSNMNNLNQTTHLKVWRKIMEKVSENQEVKEFPMPDGVKKATVCRYSGNLATRSCPAITDYFVDNDKTNTYCSGYHGKKENYFGSSKNSSYAYYSGSSSSSASTRRKKRSSSTAASSSSTQAQARSSSDNEASNSSSSNENAAPANNNSDGNAAASE